MTFQTFIKSGLVKQKSKNLSKLGFNFNSDDLESEYLKIQDMLITEYFIKNGSMLTIMEKFNIPSTKTLDILFREFDITARSLSEAGNLSILENRSHPVDNICSFVHIWHTTWNNKSVLLRSSLEKRFADYLDNLQEPYHVESMRLKYFDTEKQQYRICIPDFYLPNQHRIVEVKSTYWLDAKNMQDKKNAYNNLGYSFSLYLDSILIEDWSLPRDLNSDLPH